MPLAPLSVTAIFAVLVPPFFVAGGNAIVAPCGKVTLGFDEEKVSEP